MLTGDMLRQPAWTHPANMTATVLICSLLIVLIARARALWSALYTLLFIAAAVAAAVISLHAFQLLLIPTKGVLTLITCYSVVTLVKYQQEEKARRQIRSLFGTMVSPDVLRYLEEHPDRLTLTGRKTECTMLFSDIAGFTSIAETMPPQKLSALLNAYMTPMTQIILQHEGYVDKFNGDAIMAVWGVPYATTDHAERACRAALAQQAALDTLNTELERRFGRRIDIRIGICTGTVTAGNMGSADRFQYTVLGDAVNLAARLESLNKQYGTRILIGEATRAALPPDLALRRIDRVAVAGKQQGCTVYELRTTADPLTARYEAAWDAYAAQNWDAAEHQLRALAKDTPNDRPTQILLNRITTYRTNPPPPNWDGTHISTAK
jgi:adenylate cyclase